jgi:hypothetical protein
MTGSASRNSWVGFNSRPARLRSKVDRHSPAAASFDLSACCFATLSQCGVRCLCAPDREVCLWHKADMLNALTNVRLWGKADMDQPSLTNLDL